MLLTDLKSLAIFLKKLSLNLSRESVSMVSLLPSTFSLTMWQAYTFIVSWKQAASQAVCLCVGCVCGCQCCWLLPKCGWSLAQGVAWTCLVLVGCNTVDRKPVIWELFYSYICCRWWCIRRGTCCPGICFNDVAGWCCRLMLQAGVCAVEYINEKSKSLELAGWALFLFEVISLKLMFVFCVLRDNNNLSSCWW